MIEFLADLFGPLGARSEKPFSIGFTSEKVRIKIYRCVTPQLRQQREVSALTAALDLGIAVPRLVDSGSSGPLPWIAVESLAAEPCDALTGLERFIDLVEPVLAQLHRSSLEAPGWGWSVRPSDPARTSRHLGEQFTERVRTMPWWPALSEALRGLDPLPVVRLHGDIKPEHLLDSPAGPVLVDWEACCRGPAVLDHADLIFHVVRDRIYGGCTASAPYELKALADRDRLPVALAWRLVLWADRRRPDELSSLPAALLEQLLRADPWSAVEYAVELVEVMRRSGTPR